MPGIYVRHKGAGKRRLYYPDVIAACDPDDRELYYCERPRLIVEVLSPQHRDARYPGEAPIAYQSLESLSEYVIAARDVPRVQIYRRAQGDWELITYEADEDVRLASMELEIPMAELYA